MKELIKFIERTPAPVLIDTRPGQISFNFDFTPSWRCVASPPYWHVNLLGISKRLARQWGTCNRSSSSSSSSSSLPHCTGYATGTGSLVCASSDWIQHRATRADSPKLPLHFHSWQWQWCWGQAFISVLEFTSAQERIARKAVRDQGYLLTKTLKTHNLAFTALFHRPLGRRLISGWLSMFICLKNDFILSISMYSNVFHCFLQKRIKMNRAASIIRQTLQTAAEKDTALLSGASHFTYTINFYQDKNHIILVAS